MTRLVVAQQHPQQWMGAGKIYIPFSVSVNATAAIQRHWKGQTRYMMK
jgi:hypothetical protein